MLRCIASLIAVGSLAAAVSAADELTVSTVLTGLQRPCGVAIRPEASGENYEIYVTDAGTGRIVRIRNSEPGTGEDAIAGFASQRNGESFQSSGPCGLFFLDRTRLVVTGSGGDGHAFVRLYELSDGQTPLAAERYEQQVELSAGNAEAAASVESFHGLARTLANGSVADMLIIAAIGKQGSAGAWKLPIRAGTLGELESFATAALSDKSTVPGGVAVGPHGYVVISEPMVKNDSNINRLRFLNPIDGSAALEVTVDLPAIASLAYSPRTGNLYAAAVGSRDTQRDGVYRFDDAGEPGRPACIAVRVAEVRRPAALAFGPDGALYVAAWGEPNEQDANSGVLIRCSGEF
jgi:hypothetical protein